MKTTCECGNSLLPRQKVCSRCRAIEQRFYSKVRLCNKHYRDKPDVYSGLFAYNYEVLGFGRALLS